MREAADLRQFLLFLFALLLPCFALWHVAAAALALPATGFVNTVLAHWFPAIVDVLYADGDSALLMTRFGESDGRPVPPSQSEYQLGFAVNTRLVTYALPLYTALHFATPRRDYFNAWALGLLGLYPIMALGLLCLCLKELMTGLGAAFLAQPDAWVPPANAIALAYQVSVLLAPTLAPIGIWLWQNRATPLLDRLLESGRRRPGNGT